MSQNNPPSTARLMETLNNLFYLMVGLSLVAFVWIYLNLPAITPNIIFSVPASRPFLHAVILIISLGLVMKALLRFRRRIREIKFSAETENIQEVVLKKVTVFRQESLKMYLLLTISNFLVVAGFFLSAEPKYAAPYSVLLIILSLYRPTPESLFKKMKMKKAEQEFYYNEVRAYREG